MWDEISRVTQKEINIIDFFRNNDLPIELVSEGGTFNDFYKNHKIRFTGEFYSFDMNSYAPEIAKYKGNVYYHGYWINMHWFQNIRDQIIYELTFPEFDDDYNKEMAEKMCTGRSVGVHIRRGDFLTLGWGLDSKWYQQSVDHMKLVISNPVFYIFSDDPAWCLSNLGTLGFNTKKDNVVFVEGNTGGKNWRDMQLMTLCKNLIIANSSFSYLAALLNQNPNKYVLNPLPFRQIV